MSGLYLDVLEMLSNIGKSEADIDYVTAQGLGYSVHWDDFKRMLEAAAPDDVINDGVVIVMKDGSYIQKNTDSFDSGWDYNCFWK